MSLRIFLLAFLPAFIVTGCALPIPGSGWQEVMVGTASWNPTSGRLHRSLIGLDLRQCREIAGLTSGYSEVEVLYPVPADSRAASAKPEGLHFIFPLGLAYTSDLGTRHRFGWFLFTPDVPNQYDVSFFCHTYLGAGVGVGEHAGGFLGAGRLTALSVKPDVSGVYFLVFDSRDPNRNRLEIHREKR